jgi:mono/diheme cytochrome c family protein
MKPKYWNLRRRLIAGGAGTLTGLALLLASGSQRAMAGSFWDWCRAKRPCVAPFAGCGEEPPPCAEVGGAWYWLRSPEEEKRVTISLFNRYCIRCHGVDGRGVWDIPDVPNFTNARWQACHTDGQLVRSILEGRGSVMPPWRGALSLEEAWALARYVRTLLPGTQAERPDFNMPQTTPASAPAAPTAPPPAPVAPRPAPAAPPK